MYMYFVKLKTYATIQQKHQKSLRWSCQNKQSDPHNVCDSSMVLSLLVAKPRYTVTINGLLVIISTLSVLKIQHKKNLFDCLHIPVCRFIHVATKKKPICQ